MYDLVLVKVLETLQHALHLDGCEDLGHFAAIHVLLGDPLVEGLRRYILLCNFEGVCGLEDPKVPDYVPVAESLEDVHLLSNGLDLFFIKAGGIVSGLV